MTAATSAPIRRTTQLTQTLTIGVLIVVGSLGFAAAYGGFRWSAACIGGVLLGTLISWGTAVLHRRWPLTVLAVIVGYFIFGPALATPDSTVAGAAPSLESVRLLALGVVTSWRQLLTVLVPVGTSGALLVPVFLSALVLSVYAGAVVTRSGRPLLALLAPVAMFALAGLFGTDAGFLPLVSGGVLAVGGLMWASTVNASRGGPGFSARRPVSAVVVLAAAVAAVVFLGGPVTPAAKRLALRDSVTAPVDPKDYPSPLSGFRNYVASDGAKRQPLFTISGLPDNAMVRLAGLDQYDGIALSVSTDTGTFAKVGDRIESSTAGTRVSAALTVQNYRGVYLPNAGNLDGITFTGADRNTLTENFRYSAGSGTGMVTSGLTQGDSYDFAATIPTVPTAAAVSTAVADRSTGLTGTTFIPDQIKAAAGKYTESATGDYAKATAMTNGLKAVGHLSHGAQSELASPSGHGVDRMVRLMTDQQEAGDQEQFATALSLMMWSQAIPNRVVMGFTTGKHGSAPVTVTGADVTAWVEVPFIGVGWVAFDPTPQQTSKAPQPIPKKEAALKAQVVQPPPPPPAPDQAKSSDVDQSRSADKKIDPKKKSDDKVAVRASGPWLAVGLGGAGVVALIALVIALLLWAKSRRRARRRNAPTGHEQIAGGWSYVLDTAADFGFTSTPGVTRSEEARELDRRYGGGTVALAQRADARVFAPEPIGPEEAAGFWAGVDAALLGLRMSHSRIRRLRAKLSPASLKRRG